MSIEMSVEKRPPSSPLQDVVEMSTIAGKEKDDNSIPKPEDERVKLNLLIK